MTALHRPVRVRYRRDGNGWAYEVLAADSLVWLGGGWSAGKKRDAVEDYTRRAAREGWVSQEDRHARLKGAA